MSSSVDQELQHLRLALEGAQLGTFDHDLAHRFVRLSARACEIYGLPPCSEAPLDEMLRHADPQGLVARQRALRAALEDEQNATYEVEYQLHPPSGTRWISVRGRVLFDEAAAGSGRHPVRVVGVVADITRRKTEQLGLQNVSQMLNAIGESTNAFMYVKDRASRMLYCNGAVLKALGKTAAEVIGKTDLEFLGPGPSTDAILANDRVVMDSGEPYIYSEDIAGLERSYLSTKTPFRDVHGQVIGLAGVSLDVTELNRVRQALKDSEERAAMAVEAAEIGIYEWDPIRDKVIWSETMRRQFGLDLGEVVTLEIAVGRIHPEDRERVGTAIGSALDPNGQGRYDIEYRTVPLRGEVHWLHVLGRVRFEDRAGVRTAVYFSGVTIDITRQKALEHALRDADRRKDEFLAMLAHELRNPLAPMTYAADTLARKSDDPARVEQLAAVIARQTRHMTRLVDDLLDASRLTLGKVSILSDPLNVRDVATAAAESVLTPAIRAERRVEVQLAPEVWVAGDADRLTQMISNLLQNAVKFSAPGGRIALRLERSGAEAVISVEDDGQGIAAHLLPTVFELFVQGDDSLDRQSGGLGIGLSLVRSLAELHGGSVQAHSDGPGRGARFTLRLPLTSAPEGGPTQPAAPTPGADRILIVEDNVDAAETLQAMLQLQGHEVWIAHDGLAGLARAHELAPSVMLVDIGLPGLSGLELARRLRSELAVQPRRLVALTGYGSPKDRSEAIEAGFDLHLVKPVTFESLAQALVEPIPPAPG